MLTEALESEDFESLVDPRLEKNYVDSEMFWMIEAAAACVRHSAAKRPRMSQVVMFSNDEEIFCFVLLYIQAFLQMFVLFYGLR